MRTEIDKRAMALLSGGHLGTDFANGALPALIATFIVAGGVLGAVVLGAVADSVNLRTALWVAAAIPLLAVALGTRLPSSRRLPELRLQPDVST